MYALLEECNWWDIELQETYGVNNHLISGIILSTVITIDDTAINSGGPDGNNGGGTELWIAGTDSIQRTGLIKFNLSSDTLPSTTTNTIVSKKIGFGIATVNLAVPVGIYRLLSSFVAGTASNAVQTGSSCWNWKEYNTVAWNTAGCRGTGTDYDNTVLSTLNANSENLAYGYYVYSDFDSIYSFTNGTYTNNGFCMLRTSGSTTANFYSSEGNISPIVKITYKINNAATGYTHSVNGIAAASIASINGVAKANIAKVNGV
jgi:hypothetical protein